MEILVDFTKSNVGLRSGNEGRKGFCNSRVMIFITSGDESAQRATSDENHYEGIAKPLVTRVKPDRNAIATISTTRECNETMRECNGFCTPACY